MEFGGRVGWCTGHRRRAPGQHRRCLAGGKRDGAGSRMDCGPVLADEAGQEDDPAHHMLDRCP